MSVKKRLDFKDYENKNDKKLLLEELEKKDLTIGEFNKITQKLEYDIQEKVNTNNQYQKEGL